MGCCSSCLRRILSSQTGERSYFRTNSIDTETELSSRNQHSRFPTRTNKKSSPQQHPPYSITVSDTMSAPTILAYEGDDDDDNLEEGQVRISGYGLALIQMPMEQDAAYWEWFIEKDDGRLKKNDDGDDVEDIDSTYLAMKFGVATKKDPSFYQVQESSADEGKQKIIKYHYNFYFPSIKISLVTSFSKYKTLYFFHLWISRFYTYRRWYSSYAIHFCNNR